MRSILNLFGRSPFAPLQKHMNLVSECVHMLKDLFAALEENNQLKLEQIAGEISKVEHSADLLKNDIRNHLPKSLFLPIDRSHLLEILALQDDIADSTEDIAVLVTLKPLEALDSFREDLNIFLDKNIAAFEGARLIIKEMHELLETSFGGIEAEKVRTMVESVALKEHEIDVFQRKLLKDLFKAEDRMKYSSFHLWQQIFQAIASLSNLSERLANRVRMTLEIK
jgi:hypothetical protein